MITRTIGMLSCFFFTCSCSAPAVKEQPADPAGLFINKTLMDQLDGEKPSGEIPRLCEEISFHGNDSLEINNMVEQTRIHFSKQDDGSFFIDDPHFLQFPFTIRNDELALWDTNYLNTTTPSIFIKSEKDFTTLLNEKIICGKYLIHTGDKQDTVEFNNNGTIHNWYAWKKYALCLAGDCASMSELPANIINLVNDEKDDFFTWKMHKAASPPRLVIYALSEADPGIKGERKILNDSLVLIKLN